MAVGATAISYGVQSRSVPTGFAVLLGASGLSKPATNWRGCVVGVLVQGFITNVNGRKLSVVTRCLSKCVKSFLHFKTTLFTQDPQDLKAGSMPTTRSLPSGEPRFSECRQVFAFVIGDPIFPATEYDANPFESQRSYRCVMVAAPISLLLVVGEPTPIAQSSERPIRENFAAETSDRPSGNGPISVSL
jgi:hypothetical protein